MDSMDFRIDPDISRAETLPGRVYWVPAYHALQLDRVFARSWQLVGDSARVRAPGRVVPFTLLEGCLDEPPADARLLSVLCVEAGAPRIGRRR